MRLMSPPYYILFLSVAMLLSVPACSQHNANEQIPAWPGGFGFGVNPGHFPGWLDEDLAAIASGDTQKQVEGAGVNTFRPALPHHFLDSWGYDIRVSTFEYYNRLGMQNNVVFIGYPPEWARDTVYHCDSHRSELHIGLYDDIWDDGQNGTPVNDNNHFASYCFQMARRYKDVVRIWEVWNEPDFSFAPAAYNPRTSKDSWWQREPLPCELAIKAPIEQYVRMLRIAYEVIKSVDSEALIATGGIGYPSFLYQVLRNTDNPNGGLLSTDYPLKGGAYFDVLSFHSYPHIDGSMKTWNNDKHAFDYMRNSDAAVDGLLRLQDEMLEVLYSFGYDGKNMPKKHSIVTETNVPRKQYGEFLGSETAQVNYTIKSMVKAMQHNIRQIHIYGLAELEEEANAKGEYDLMGLYKRLPATPYQATKTNQGIAFTTIANFLRGYNFSAIATAAMQLPDHLDGAAYVQGNLPKRYIIWLKTHQDRNEENFGLVSLPITIRTQALTKHEWDYSLTGIQEVISAGCIKLGATPIFLEETADEQVPFDFEIVAYWEPSAQMVTIDYCLTGEATIQFHLHSSNGKLIGFSEKLHNQYGFQNYSIPIDGTILPGIYFLTAAVGSDKKTVKVLVR